ncbi:TIGR01777 family oxidoreductase [Sediminitomix flava]|uniref:TIGR01777 family protein n=1 Tax=Sediminitomix flava TaxID=379075 RepID=A0A315ZII3_SEDFL|nr:TIGR01777 family oxidoreductase [Sediminitomix flava]PWJ44910.1 hypothetical protein BC781_1011299 [Sediminitomix flava]
MRKTVLITGGTGLVGSFITKLLIEKGYRVSYLSRKKKESDQITYYQWDVNKGEIEKEAITTADYIINLAGAGIADQRWTSERKKEIYNSRIQSTKLLVDKLKEYDNHVQAVISTSAVGIYGNTPTLVNEDTTPASDFLAKVCVDWEKEIEKLTDIRTAIVRVGIVLSKKGGALEKMATPVKMMAGAPLGDGQQYISWIHIEDLCREFIYLMESNQEGIFNGVAPKPVTNKQLTKSIAKTLGRPLILPNVPTFALKMMMGEMADMVLSGANVSAEKLKSTGFRFHFENVDEALEDLL